MLATNRLRRYTTYSHIFAETHYLQVFTKESVAWRRLKDFASAGNFLVILLMVLANQI